MDLFALATVPTRPDEARGPPPQSSTSPGTTSSRVFVGSFSAAPDGLHERALDAAPGAAPTRPDPPLHWKSVTFEPEQPLTQ